MRNMSSLKSNVSICEAGLNVDQSCVGGPENKQIRVPLHLHKQCKKVTAVGRRKGGRREGPRMVPRLAWGKQGADRAKCPHAKAVPVQFRLRGREHAPLLRCTEWRPRRTRNYRSKNCIPCQVAIEGTLLFCWNKRTSGQNSKLHSKALLLHFLIILRSQSWAKRQQKKAKDTLFDVLSPTCHLLLSDNHCLTCSSIRPADVEHSDSRARHTLPNVGCLTIVLNILLP